jgi:putative Mg2+ transporter-C (MgtC) family protein
MQGFTMEVLLTQWDSQLSGLLNVFIAVILGGVVGLERELARKPAGLRTLMLVAGASAMLVGITDTLIEHFTEVSEDQILRADPIRIVEAIITGVSFICAGTIFRSDKGETVEGLTTAAAILTCCTIGIAVALKQWILAAGVTFLTVIILRAAAAVEEKMATRTTEKNVSSQ